MQQKNTLYYQVKESIQTDILDGVYPVGSMLPTENEFENKFGVSKITVRKAIELLEQDGYVKKKSGYGTTVISNSIYNKLSKGMAFSNILQQQDLQLHKKHYPMERVTITNNDEISAAFGPVVTKLKRRYFLNEAPYIYMEHFLPGKVDLAENLEEDYQFSIYMFLYKNGFVINRFEDFFFTIVADKNLANELDIDEDMPLLGRKRYSYDAKDQIIEISYAYYNTVLHPYQINYHV